MVVYAEGREQDLLTASQLTSLISDIVGANNELSDHHWGTTEMVMYYLKGIISENPQ